MKEKVLASYNGLYIDGYANLPTDAAGVCLLEDSMYLIIGPTKLHISYHAIELLNR